MFGSSRETPPAGRRASKDVECATEEVTEEPEPLAVLLPPLVELPVCFAVPDEPVVAEPLFVFELLAVGGTVCAADDEAELLLLSLLLLSFCLATKASSSGNHRGQGHAAVKVERKSRTSE